MAHILDLMPEIHEKIYSYCYCTDLLNLACCSSSYNNALKYILWKKIKIPWSTLGKKWIQWICFGDSLMKKRLENLKYTTFLSFYEDGSENVTDEKRWENICTNYKRILEYCNPEKLVTLFVEGVIDDEGVELTCRLLDKLEVLSMKCCYHVTIVGWRFLASLKHLQKLSILSCDISDETIETICRNASLKELHLYQFLQITNWSLSHISQQLVELKKLTVSYNTNISPIGFHDMGKLCNLVELDLKYTSTDNSILSIVCKNLLQLKVLNLRGCRISNAGLLELPKLRYLEDLDINGCANVNDEGLFHLSALSTLKKLNMSHCFYITNIGVLHLNNLTVLQELHMGWCRKVTDDNLSIISHLEFLSVLDISRCANITDVGLSHLGTMMSLREVSLNACVLVSDAGILELAKLVWLKSLDIGYTCISDAGLKELNVLRFLAELDITGCTNVTDIGISYLATFTLLERLNISHTMVTSDGLSHLHNLTFLKEFNVNACAHLSDTSLCHIGKMLSLESLGIGLTDVTDTGLQHLRTLRSLRKLECWHTDITSTGLSRLAACSLLKDVQK